MGDRANLQEAAGTVNGSPAALLSVLAGEMFTRLDVLCHHYGCGVGARVHLMLRGLTSLFLDMLLMAVLPHF